MVGKNNMMVTDSHYSCNFINEWIKVRIKYYLLKGYTFEQAVILALKID